jgi:hypothetical protein
MEWTGLNRLITDKMADTMHFLVPLEQIISSQHPTPWSYLSSSTIHSIKHVLKLILYSVFTVSLYETSLPHNEPQEARDTKRVL